MAQITEDYIGLETAKLLKEKGFTLPVKNYYSLYTEDVKYNLQKKYGAKMNWNSFALTVSRPSQSLVMKWLREVHHYYIQVMFDSWASGRRLGYFVVIHKTDSDFEMMLHYAVDEAFYKTYEEACEAAIKYCLENLI